MSGGRKINRRDFLKGVGATAASAAAGKIPLPVPQIAQQVSQAAGIDPSILLPPGLSKGFSLPHGMGELVMLGDKAVRWGGWDAPEGSLTRRQMEEVAKAMERARSVMPPGMSLQSLKDDILWNLSVPTGVGPSIPLMQPLHYNHLTGRWHEAAYVPTEDPSVRQIRYLKASQTAPPGFEQFSIDPTDGRIVGDGFGTGDIHAMIDDVMESDWTSGTLNSPPGMLRGHIDHRYNGSPHNAIEDFRQDWLRDRTHALHEAQRSADGDARRVDPELLRDFELAPGGRFQQTATLTPDDSQITGNQGLPGDERTSRTGRIRRLLEVGVPITAAVTAAGTASASEQPVFAAGEGEALVPYLKRMSDQMPLQVPSRQKGAAIMRDAPVGIGLEGRLPDMSSSISDSQWADWYDERANKGDDPLHEEFKQAQLREMGQPVVNLGDGQKISPLEALDLILMDEKLGVTPERRQYVQDSVLARLSGEPYDRKDKVAQAAYSQLMQAVQGSSPDGDNAEFAYHTDSEYKDLQDAHGWAQARYQLPAAGKRNFDAQRVYDTMRVFQDDEHAPAYASDAAAPIAGVGAIFDGSGDTEMLADARHQGGPSGRLREWQYWNNRSKNDQFRFADTLSGANYPDQSSTTLAGIGKKLGQSEGIYSGLALPVERAFQEPVRSINSMVSGDRHWDFMNSLNQRLNRTVPVIPDAADPKEMQQLRKDHLMDVSSGRDWLGAQWPRMAHNLNNAFGTQVMKPEYLSPAADTAANLPKDWIADPFTLGSLAAGAVTGGLGGLAAGGLASVGKAIMGASPKQMAKSLAGYVGREAPSEIATEAAIQKGGPGDITTPQAWEQQKSNSLMLDEEGRQIAADDPQFLQKYGQASQRKNEKFYNNYLKYGPMLMDSPK